MDDVLRRLERWYTKQCNGDWEHQYGVKIESVDNPGWRVEIDLAETAWQDVTFAELRVRREKRDWIMCFKNESRFVGSGDPSKLEEILIYFLTVVKG